MKYDAITQLINEETKEEPKSMKTKDKLLSRVKIDDDEPVIEEVKENPKAQAAQPVARA